MRGVGHRRPHLVLGGGQVGFEEHARLLSCDGRLRAALLALPASLQVDQSAADLADVVVELAVGYEL